MKIVDENEKKNGKNKEKKLLSEKKERLGMKLARKQELEKVKLNAKICAEERETQRFG